MSDCKCKIHGEDCGRMMFADGSLANALSKFIAKAEAKRAAKAEQEAKVARWRQAMGKFALPPRWEGSMLRGAGVLTVPIASIPDMGVKVAVHQGAHKACGTLSCNTNAPVSQCSPE